MIKLNKQSIIQGVATSPRNLLCILLKNVLDHPKINSEWENWLGVHNTKQNSYFLLTSYSRSSGSISTCWIVLYRGGLYYDGIGDPRYAFCHFNKKSYNDNLKFDSIIRANNRDDIERRWTSEDYKQLKNKKESDSKLDMKIYDFYYDLDPPEQELNFLTPLFD